jgi:uncharacterized protein (TIGR02246 family)
MPARPEICRPRFLFPVLFLLWMSGCASAGESPARTDAVEEVRALYLSGIDAFNAHELERFMEQFADDIRMYTPTGWLTGKAAVRERFAQTFEQFPSVQMVIEDLQVRSVSPDAALVEFRWRVHPLGSGPAFEGVGSGVYVRRDGRWVEVLEHETIVRTDPELIPPPTD